MIDTYMSKLSEFPSKNTFQIRPRPSNWFKWINNSFAKENYFFLITDTDSCQLASSSTKLVLRGNGQKVEEAPDKFITHSREKRPISNLEVTDQQHYIGIKTERGIIHCYITVYTNCSGGRSRKSWWKLWCFASVTAQISYVKWSHITLQGHI